MFEHIHLTVKTTHLPLILPVALQLAMDNDTTHHPHENQCQDEIQSPKYFHYHTLGRCFRTFEKLSIIERSTDSFWISAHYISFHFSEYHSTLCSAQVVGAQHLIDKHFEKL